VCDNFSIGADCAPAILQKETGLAMVEELEQEYSALKDKVRDLREYL
jgi:hypothetical protein